jgi:hypothetical protein
MVEVLSEEQLERKVTRRGGIEVRGTNWFETFSLCGWERERGYRCILVSSRPRVPEHRIDRTFGAKRFRDYVRIISWSVTRSSPTSAQPQTDEKIKRLVVTNVSRDVSYVTAKF